MNTLLRWFSVFSFCAAVAGAAAAPLGDLSPAPEFKLQTLDGTEVSAASLRGKVVVVDFWATWCGPCLVEIPGYVELQNKYRDQGLVIVGVSLDRKGAGHVKQFADKNRINYPLAMGDESIVDAFGGFTAIPTTFLIDREGRIRHEKTGAMEKAEYEKLIRALL